MKHVLFPAVVGLSLTGLVACMSTDEWSDPDACGASKLQGLIGQPESVLDTVTLADEVYMRVIRPDQMVTADFNPVRLNVWLNKSEHIIRMNCG